MDKTELVIQLLKAAIAIAFAAYFLWWEFARPSTAARAIRGVKRSALNKKGPPFPTDPLVAI